jgi:hypothetical protein
MKLLWLSSALLLASCVSGADALTSTDQAISAKHACPASVPAALAPAADQDLAFALDATGTQNYACQATTTGYAWTLVAPEALLSATHGRCHDHDPVIHHFAGPTWQSIDDGSSVVGAKVAGVTVDATAIPWLLLTAVSHGAPTDGEDEGLLTPITSVQRLSTGGGLAPATGCDAAHVGATANIAYTARYFFYRTNTHHPEHNVRCGG